MLSIQNMFVTFSADYLQMYISNLLAQKKNMKIQINIKYKYFLTLFYCLIFEILLILGINKNCLCAATATAANGQFSHILVVYSEVLFRFQLVHIFVFTGAKVEALAKLRVSMTTDRKNVLTVTWLAILKIISKVMLKFTNSNR